MTPFQVLELAEDASPEEVRLAYRRLAAQAHPDAGGSAEAFSALVKARKEAEVIAYAAFCPACHGSGQNLISSGFTTLSMPCTYCKGIGRRYQKT